MTITFTIPQKMSNSGSIHDIASDMFDRNITFTPGCKFAARCPYVKDVCIQREPELLEPEPNHRVRCFKYDPETKALWAGVGKATWNFEGEEVLINTTTVNS